MRKAKDNSFLTLEFQVYLDNRQTDCLNFHTFPDLHRNCMYIVLADEGLEPFTLALNLLVTSTFMMF